MRTSSAQTASLSMDRLQTVVPSHLLDKLLGRWHEVHISSCFTGMSMDSVAMNDIVTVCRTRLDVDIRFQVTATFEINGQLRQWLRRAHPHAAHFGNLQDTCVYTQCSCQCGAPLFSCPALEGARGIDQRAVCRSEPPEKILSWRL